METPCPLGSGNPVHCSCVPQSWAPHPTISALGSSSTLGSTPSTPAYLGFLILSLNLMVQPRVGGKRAVHSAHTHPLHFSPQSFPVSGMKSPAPSHLTTILLIPRRAYLNFGSLKARKILSFFCVQVVPPFC